ncbi:Cardiolipin synthase B [Ralstonia mannitolilytica]|uniref:cardiolipin synthase ClsB n=1 Tax=Ralstonia mannitolilytica TaxID=105219 RepID=UPI0028F618DD|nr:cardiolipin synthase ClsB [Ralstonia mannitolilytica]CAJ0691959.1 Cardiolipin synthase B [Ralstonia mannitolilytica]CAJ0786266.1 Cardiolipin synthase B [Ralstonia mannitolilytica]
MKGQHDAGPLRSEWRRGKPLPGNNVDLLCGGGEFFPALIEAIDRATRRVAIETYIYADDAAGRSVTEALARAARRGVEVHLTIDGFGTGTLPPDLAAMLDAAGVTWRVYRPVRGFRLQRRYLRRLHRKLAVVDDDVAFVGGINIIDDLNHAPFNDASLGPRYDFAVRVRGPLVAQIALTTDRLWWQMGVRAGMRQVGVTGVAADFPLITDTPRPRHRGASGRESEPAPGSVLASLVLRDNVRNRRAIEREYLRALGTARHEVIIANAYFLPGVRFMRALAACRRRGVRVRLLLQGQVEYRLQHYATRSLYHMLLRDGVEIHEYTASFLHAKVAVVDERWATVGSSNIDPFSLLLAREANVVVWDATVANELRAALEAAIAQHGRCVLADAHAARRWWWRLADWCAYQVVRLGVIISGRAAQY